MPNYIASQYIYGKVIDNYRQFTLRALYKQFFARPKSKFEQKVCAKYSKLQ